MELFIFLYDLLFKEWIKQVLKSHETVLNYSELSVLKIEISI